MLEGGVRSYPSQAPTQHPSECPRRRPTLPLKCKERAWSWTSSKKRDPSLSNTENPLYLLNDPIASKAGDELGWGSYSEVSVQVQFLVLMVSFH